MSDTDTAWAGPTGDDFGKPGWRYCDLPNLAKPEFDKYISIIGADNIQWITIAERQWADGTTTYRGQHIISPDGQANGAAYANRDKTKDEL